jgi:hypothetical protein
MFIRARPGLKPLAARSAATFASRFQAKADPECTLMQAVATQQQTQTPQLNWQFTKLVVIELFNRETC